MRVLGLQTDTFIDRACTRERCDAASIGDLRIFYRNEYRHFLTDRCSRVVSRRHIAPRAPPLPSPPSRCPTSGPPGSATAPPTLSPAAWSSAARACPTPRSTASSTEPVRPRPRPPFLDSRLMRHHADRAPAPARRGSARAAAFLGNRSIDARRSTRRRRASRAGARDRASARRRSIECNNGAPMAARSRLGLLSERGTVFDICVRHLQRPKNKPNANASSRRR